MNEVWYEVDFMHSDKHQSFVLVAPTIFGGRGQACLDSQSNCRILKCEVLHKELDELP